MRHKFIDRAPATHATVRLAVAGLVCGSLAIVGPARASASASSARFPGAQVFVRVAARIQAAADGPMPAAATSGRLPQARLARSAVPAAFPQSAGPAAVRDPCPPDADGAVCGHVDVPLDRGDPLAGSISIHFELYLHTDPGQAKSAIIVNFGGPGASTTAMRSIPLFWFGPAYADHDVLLIDDRGTGSSGALDCPAYQHDSGPLLQIVGQCAAQLGASAIEYSTAEVAADDDAVRAALGYNAVDFVGTSFGGVDAAAYATRFSGHLHSLLLDTPVSTAPNLGPIATAAAGTRRDIDRVGTLCSRSPACGRSAPEAIDSIRWLARRVRSHPVAGTALDADGAPHDLIVDPTYLFVHILDNTPGPFLTAAEIPAAADALARGDAVPLLRLAAESDAPIPGDAGDPTGFSQGAFSATLCLDSGWPWSPNASLPARQDQWAHAVHNTPNTYFAPFRADEILFSVYGLSDFCLPWPQTGTRPPVEPAAHYPRVPTLVLQGELDALPFVPETATLYPQAKLITVVGAGHNTFSWGPCGGDLAVQFLETLKVTDSHCASETPMNYPGVTAFPRAASASPAATPDRYNQASPADLRIARVAADAALDAVKRSFVSSGTGPGLRGGTFHADFGDVSLTTTLTGAQWTEDVAVSGTLHWSYDDGALDADLQIDGPGLHDGTLHMHGGWLIPRAARSLTISGTLSGKHVAATVPST